MDSYHDLGFSNPKIGHRLHHESRAILRSSNSSFNDTGPLVNVARCTLLYHKDS